ncbi:crotonase/enoyl-CoA hydratase family protein [Leptospira gomenensis]|uniref:Crotonase/enoyl-CoA hydratase family protein n=1 Tax=Leptospira gomenensis TaxID=2484974 RepID=A0A5F1YHH6_9LEPT|nr:crotonase/enoyl-CoA hydratase family protein [Leptospira gomenensis]TGK37583.1 crotonase/enoyl-CoA hydratase family protein [Leptospira gomenensis]TGK39410.1 crotonase/enoyl-CoA hydratase family protein [Leptospira gomenensis]TGK43168.1 crotonase/enoyl-CoA hydratase family protein [Leptospira gomenensis]TGK55003.1 crotonase/enoyl-CoA hydratase family protein [Leptospira gomenensis]
MSDPILTEKKGAILHIVFNRPEERNAFNVDMLYALSAAYDLLENDPELRVGLVYANGKHFTLGLDLKNVADFLKKERRFPLPSESVNPWGTTPDRFRTKPIVTAVHGMCLTLGIELLLASDVRIAAKLTVFAQVEVQRGIFPFGGGTIRWPAQCGWGNAMRYILTGEPFDAEEAYRIGLVQEVVEKDRLIRRGVQLAESIAAQAPLGVYATLRSSWESVVLGETAAARTLFEKLLNLMDSEDAEEGLNSFLEKRTAVFRGK